MFYHDTLSMLSSSYILEAIFWVPYHSFLRKVPYTSVLRCVPNSKMCRSTMPQGNDEWEVTMEEVGYTLHRISLAPACDVLLCWELLLNLYFTTNSLSR